jgi:hypothetical protein
MMKRGPRENSGAMKIPVLGSNELQSSMCYPIIPRPAAAGFKDRRRGAGNIPGCDRPSLTAVTELRLGYPALVCRDTVQRLATLCRGVSIRE